jgi:hypothetical protein
MVFVHKHSSMSVSVGVSIGVTTSLTSHTSSHHSVVVCRLASRRAVTGPEGHSAQPPTSVWHGATTPHVAGTLSRCPLCYTDVNVSLILRE